MSSNGSSADGEVLALIPARAGSRRVAHKNIRPLVGRPLIAYTIEAALRSRQVRRVIVSTDAAEIAAVARASGAEVPFLRPGAIAGADATELEFLDHALEWLAENENYEPELIVLLYPTAPLRRPESIDRAIELLRAHPEADSLRSVRRCREHPYKMWRLDGDRLQPFVRDPMPVANMHTLSYHLLPEVYVQNANIYITRPVTIRTQRSSTGAVIIPFVMDAAESVDINEPIDFRLAELLIKEGPREV